jgi:hypothetical protein
MHGQIAGRTPPDRDTGDRERLLLPPGGDLRRLRAADMPTVIGTWIGYVAWAAATFYGPETKDKVLCPIWSAPETGRARPVGGGERRNARAA